MGYSNRTIPRHDQKTDLLPEDFEVKSPRINLKKRQCVECGRNFTPSLKIDYCCNQCKLENSQMFAEYSDLGR